MGKELQINQYDSILWSGWSAEERQKHVKTWRVIIDYVKSVDGSLHFGLSREEARKIELPDTLYEQFVVSIKETNRWMDSTNMPAAERAEMCDDYAETTAQLFGIPNFIRTIGWDIKTLNFHDYGGKTL